MVVGRISRDLAFDSLQLPCQKAHFSPLELQDCSFHVKVSDITCASFGPLQSQGSNYPSCCPITGSWAYTLREAYTQRTLTSKTWESEFQGLLSAADVAASNGGSCLTSLPTAVPSTFLTQLFSSVPEPFACFIFFSLHFIFSSFPSGSKNI